MVFFSILPNHAVARADFAVDCRDTFGARLMEPGEPERPARPALQFRSRKPP
jgi:hypothetical protein